MQGTCLSFNCDVILAWSPCKGDSICTKTNEPFTQLLFSQHLKKQTYLLPQHFEFFLKLACTYNLPSHNLPQLTYHNIFHGIIKNIQLHKQLLHCYIFYLGVAMTKQMKNQSKFDNFFLLVNLNYTMNDMLQHCFKTKLGQNITFH